MPNIQSITLRCTVAMTSPVFREVTAGQPPPRLTNPPEVYDALDA